LISVLNCDTHPFLFQKLRQNVADPRDQRPLCVM
jgi:hypothetical protein